MRLNELIVLGSGSAIQFEGRASASYLLKTDKGNLLLDAGFLVMDRLERAGVRADEIDFVYISHKHPDHYMGLLHIIFSLLHKYYKRAKPVQAFGFAGLEEWHGKFREILGCWIEPSCGVVFGKPPFIGADIFSTSHSASGTGITINFENLKLTYTGDTEYFPELADICSGSDVLIAECGAGSNKHVRGHMSLKDVKKVVKNGNVRTAVLSHIYPDTDRPAPEWTEEGTRFVIAEDLMSFRF
jgi:ribonuclease BN (tRNA processing enzyme)